MATNMFVSCSLVVETRIDVGDAGGEVAATDETHEQRVAGVTARDGVQATTVSCVKCQLSIIVTISIHQLEDRDHNSMD